MVYTRNRGSMTKCLNIYIRKQSTGNMKCMRKFCSHNVNYQFNQSFNINIIIIVCNVNFDMQISRCMFKNHQDNEVKRD